MKSDDIIEFIDNTIMVKLNNNNIFEKFRSLEEIRQKLIYTVYDVNFEDLTQKECDGFWSPSAKRLVIDKKLENPITQKNEALRVKIHELLHALTTKFISNVEERWGIQQITNSHWFLDKKGQRVDIPFEEKGRGLNEGITEYLAQKLCPEENYKYDEKGQLIEEIFANGDYGHTAKYKYDKNGCLIETIFDFDEKNVTK